jgi:hypothetical protein
MQRGARKITQRGPLRVVGKFLSVKNRDAVPWESQNEEACCYFLEVDPVIRSFCSQPCKIAYELDGVHRHYTPDFRERRQPSIATSTKKKPTAKVGAQGIQFHTGRSIMATDGSTGS